MVQTTYKSVWRLAGPNILSNILMVSISFAHLWMIAPFGPEASAAVVTGARIHFLLMSAAMALSVATTAIVARAWGAEDTEEASAATTSSLSLTVFVSVLLGGITYVYAPQFVSLFKLDQVSSQMAIAYIRPIAILNIIFTLTLTIATAFRAIGDVMRPMVFTAYSTVLGIIGSYVLLHGSWGFPEYGISGIAYGTALGQLLVLLWFTAQYLRKKYILTPVPKAILNNNRFTQLLKIGAPAAFEQILIQSSFLVFMMLVANYGTPAFAAYGIGITILSICIVVGLGFGTASAALAGQSLGALSPENAIKNGWITMRLALICMILMAIVTYLLREPLANMLSTDLEVRAYTEYFILILAIIQPFMAIEFAIGGALRGAGDTKYPLLVTFIGMIVGRLSIGFIVLKLGYSVETMYAVIIADYAIKSTLLILRFRSGKWLEAAGKHLPLAVQSVAGVGREPVRAYATEHIED